MLMTEILFPVVFGVVGAIVISVLMILAIECEPPKLEYPPFDPPIDADAWRVLAFLRLAPKPRLPCGCRADWSDVPYGHNTDADGTVYESIRGLNGCSDETTEYRNTVVNNGGVYIKTDYGRVRTHNDCGRSWAVRRPSLSPRSVQAFDHPRDSDSVAGLPGGWTPLDNGVSSSRGEVKRYLFDIDWGAEIVVYDARSDGNDYSLMWGRYCARLRVKSPTESCWTDYVRHGDDQRELAVDLMNHYNDDLYEGDSSDP